MSEFNLNEQAEIAEDFLRTYGYGTANANTIREHIFSKWWEAKTEIRNVLRRHPNWDEEKQAVIFSENYECGIDSIAIRSFCEWARKTALNRVKENSKPLPERAEYEAKRNAYMRIYDRLDLITEEKVTTMSEMPEIVELMKESLKLMRMYREKIDKIDSEYTDIGAGLYAPKSEDEWYLKTYSFLNLLTSAFQQLADEEFAQKVNEIYPEIKAVAGMKVSKIVNKFGKLTGLDKIKDEREVVQGGENKIKDFGWNYQFAAFADAVNPIKVEAITCISINPFDYWTMSFGTNWSSCHTIDKANYDDRSSTYEGQYSAGTESYMLDRSSIVFYTVNPHYEGYTSFTPSSEIKEILENHGDIWRVPKSRRQMYHMAENGDTFISSRLYPDARDGGDTGLAAQYRNTFERVWSECQERPNLWDIRKGRYACEDYTNSYGHHYRDYTEYNDAALCIRKGTVPIVIGIGHNAICPSCGFEHSDSNSISCCDNVNVIGHCDWCDGPIYEDSDEIYCEDNARSYCCQGCAEQDGVHWCENDYTWHSEGYCYLDDYDGIYYSGNPEVEADGYHYSSYDHAYDDGLRYSEAYGQWYSEREVFYDEYEEDWYPIEDAIKIGTEYYGTDASAENAGYMLDDNGNWVKEVA